MRTIVLVALSYCVVTRLFELVLSRRNLRALGSSARVVRSDGMLAIVCVHVAWFAGIAAEELALGPRAIPETIRWSAAFLYVLSEGVRGWCILALGARWNVRVVVCPGAERIRGGPYAFLPHPNYAAVVLELLALPLVHSAWLTAVVYSLANAAVLRLRIRAENRALGYVG